MSVRTVNFASLSGKRVLLRVDLDLPVEQGVVPPGLVRFDSALATIQQLQAAGARVIVMGHRGRPEGVDLEMSILPIAQALMVKLPKESARFVAMGDQKDLVAATQVMAKGDVLILENLRFHPGEQKNDPTFAKQLAALGDVYMDDAFGNCHRDHASMTGITQFLESFAGPTIVRELEALEPVRSVKTHPYVAIVGGKKIASKLHALTALLKEADVVFVGGSIATTFFVAQGLNVGASLYVPEDVALAELLLQHTSLRLPVDVVVKKPDGTYAGILLEAIEPTDVIVDLGSESVLRMRTELEKAKMILWNGPVGIIEEPASRVGSDAIAHLVAEFARGAVYGVVGGGNTVGLLEELRLTDFIDHVSTGGGAMLEYVGGQTLPALEVLKEETYVRQN
ncbi:phosphoglycerate kinase [Candidatus Uhrbacteria bacterium CG10_big_fil_rev_8_21_14_0_10_50_16]|uniref:Phosphoglycerate kinase n=1 Tax=Candidatus Uhrbacteria bacterium CG10_big_fil_rev_8_21_14_0_10_50_16 TaxID=1975039 RepID=A0A2H0RMH7_9BACT|nr:MAG: phosphoglycerate kinase [Candidatus Uhrbacteria bacterium CG10_big_fil_rev_8_21_14_0_10_50_16]